MNRIRKNTGTITWYLHVEQSVNYVVKRGCVDIAIRIMDVTRLGIYIYFLKYATIVHKKRMRVCGAKNEKHVSLLICLR